MMLFALDDFGVARSAAIVHNTIFAARVVNSQISEADFYEIQFHVPLGYHLRVWKFARIEARDSDRDLGAVVKEVLIMMSMKTRIWHVNFLNIFPK